MPLPSGLSAKFFCRSSEAGFGPENATSDSADPDEDEPALPPPQAVRARLRPTINAITGRDQRRTALTLPMASSFPSRVLGELGMILHPGRVDGTLVSPTE